MVIGKGRSGQSQSDDLWFGGVGSGKLGGPWSGGVVSGAQVVHGLVGLCQGLRWSMVWWGCVRGSGGPWSGGVVSGAQVVHGLVGLCQGLR